MADDNRNVQVQLSADPSGYQKAMAAANASTSALIKSAGTLAVTLDRVWKGASRKLELFGSAGVASMGAYVAAANSLDKAFSQARANAAVTGQSMAGLGSAADKLSKTLPMTNTQIRQLMGQVMDLGATGTRQITAFTEQAIKLGAATNTPPGQLFAQLLQMTRQMGSSTSLLSNYGSELVSLSKQSGQSATNILQFSDSISAVAQRAGFSQAQVLSLGTSFTKAGADGYAGAQVFNQVVNDITQSIQTGSGQLNMYANLVGMTSQSFKDLAKSNPAQAFIDVIQSITREGPKALITLEQLGLNNARTTRAIASLAGPQADLQGTMKSGQQAFSDNTATNKAAAASWDSLSTSMEHVRNEMQKFAQTMGGPFLKPVTAVVNVFAKILEAVNSIPGPIKTAGAVMLGIGSALTLATGLFLGLALAITKVGTALRLTLLSGPAINAIRGLVASLRMGTAGAVLPEGLAMQAGMAGRVGRGAYRGGAAAGAGMANSVAFMRRFRNPDAVPGGFIGPLTLAQLAARETAAEEAAAAPSMMRQAGRFAMAPAVFARGQFRWASDAFRKPENRPSRTFFSGSVRTPGVDEEPGFMARSVNRMSGFVPSFMQRSGPAPVSADFIGPLRAGQVREGEIAATRLAKVGSAAGTAASAAMGLGGKLLGLAGPIGLMAMVALPLISAFREAAKAGDKAAKAMMSLPEFKNLPKTGAPNPANPADRPAPFSPQDVNAARATSFNQANADELKLLNNVNSNPQRRAIAQMRINNLVRSNNGPLTADQSQTLRQELINTMGPDAAQAMWGQLNMGGSGATGPQGNLANINTLVNSAREDANRAHNTWRGRQPSRTLGYLAQNIATASSPGEQAADIAQVFKNLGPGSGFNAFARQLNSAMGLGIKTGGIQDLGGLLDRLNSTPAGRNFAAQLSANGLSVNGLRTDTGSLYDAMSSKEKRDAYNADMDRASSTLNKFTQGLNDAAEAAKSLPKAIFVPGSQAAQANQEQVNPNSLTNLMGSLFPNIYGNNQFQLGQTDATNYQQQLYRLQSTLFGNAGAVSGPGNLNTAIGTLGNFLGAQNNPSGAQSQAAQALLTQALQSRGGQLTGNYNMATASSMMVGATRQLNFTDPNEASSVQAGIGQATQYRDQALQELKGYVIQEEDAYYQERHNTEDHYRQLLIMTRDHTTQITEAYYQRNLQVQQANHDFNEQLRTANYQMMQTFDSFHQVQAQYTMGGDTSLLTSNIQNTYLQRSQTAMDRLAKMGLSRDAIRTLNLDDPKNFEQAERMVQDLANNPKLVQQWNSSIAKKLSLSNAIDTDINNAKFADMKRNFDYTANQASQAFQHAMAQTNTAWQNQLGDFQNEFMISNQRINEDIQRIGRDTAMTMEQVMTKGAQSGVANIRKYTTEIGTASGDISKAIDDLVSAGTDAQIMGYATAADTNASGVVSASPTGKIRAMGQAGGPEDTGWKGIEEAVSELGISFGPPTPGQTYARSGNSEHSQGRAVDFGDATSPSARIAQALVKYAQGTGSPIDELIYAPLNIGYKNGTNLGEAGYGADTWNQHYNHVHVGVRPGVSLAAVVAGDPSAGYTVGQKVTPQNILNRAALAKYGYWDGSGKWHHRDWFHHGQTSMVANHRLNVGAANKALQYATGMLGGIRSAFATNSVEGTGLLLMTPGGLSGAQSNAVQLGQQMAGRAGWSGNEWSALYNLWMKESSWNPYAVNSGSGAYGIPQSLGHGHPYNLGDAGAQIAWGLQYIAQRYGDPLSAWAHEKAMNWYGAGAIVNKPTIAGVGEAGPEAILPLNNIGATFMANVVRHAITQTGLTRGMAQGTRTAPYAASVTVIRGNVNNHYDGSTNFTGDVTVQANDPNAMANQLQARARLARLTRPVTSPAVGATSG